MIPLFTPVMPTTTPMPQGPGQVLGGGAFKGLLDAISGIPPDPARAPATPTPLPDVAPPQGDAEGIRLGADATLLARVDGHAGKESDALHGAGDAVGDGDQSGAQAQASVRGRDAEVSGVATGTFSGVPPVMSGSGGTSTSDQPAHAIRDAAASDTPSNAGDDGVAGIGNGGSVLDAVPDASSPKAGDLVLAKQPEAMLPGGAPHGEAQHVTMQNPGTAQVTTPFPTPPLPLIAQVTELAAAGQLPSGDPRPLGSKAAEAPAKLAHSPAIQLVFTAALSEGVSKAPTGHKPDAARLDPLPQAESRLHAMLSTELSSAPSPAPSPSAAATLPPSVPEARLPVPITQLAQTVDTLARKSAEGSVEITLSPAELGRVRLSLTETDGAIRVIVQTERPETAELIRRHLGELGQDLRDLGYRNPGFSFAGDPGQRETPSGPLWTREHLEEEGHGTDAADRTSPSPARVVSPGGLDLRI